MAAADESHRSRRTYDDILPVVMLKVEEKVAETRHLLRNEQVTATVSLTNEISALRAQVADGTLQSTREHAEVKACLEELRGTVAELKGTVDRQGSRLTVVERHDDIDDAREKTRDDLIAKIDSARHWAIGTALSVLGVVVAATAVILQHQ